MSTNDRSPLAERFARLDLAASEESQRFLATLMSNLPGMVYRRRPDPDATMEFVSEGCCELTGYPASDLIGNRAVSYVELVHPDDREYTQEYRQVALRHKRPYGYAYRITTASGAERWVYERGRGIFSPQGELLALEGFVADHTERVMAFLALEKRIEERTREIEQRHRVAESMREILSVLNSSRSLSEVLDYIVSCAARLLGAEACSITRLDADTGVLTIQAACGLPADYVANVTVPLGQLVAGASAARRQPVSVPDLQAYSRQHEHWLEDPVRGPHLRWLIGHYGAVLGVPLLIKDEVYGSIVFYYAQPRGFAAEEISLASAFANQAALAIENARLQAEVEQNAVSAERQRLARTLHDSVTQTLFSASLVAEALPRLWERDEADGRQMLVQLRELIQGALAEMRTLLVELRPAALTDAPLADLLAQLVTSTSSWGRLPIDLAVQGRERLPPDVQAALYRITQEALNNVLRHAGASRAEVSLRQTARGVTLRIADDGRGFDPRRTLPGHLGLPMMRERAEGIGARLHVSARPGRGTHVAMRHARAQQVYLPMRVPRGSRNPMRSRETCTAIARRRYVPVARHEAKQSESLGDCFVAENAPRNDKAGSC